MLTVRAYLKDNYDDAFGVFVPHNTKGYVYDYDEDGFEYDFWFSPDGDEFDGYTFDVTSDDFVEILTDLQLTIIHWFIYLHLMTYNVGGVIEEYGVKMNTISHLDPHIQHQILDLSINDFTPLMRSVFDDILKHSNLPAWEDEDV